MADNAGTHSAAPPPDLVAALTTMGSHIIERNFDYVRDLMGCSDPAAVAAVTTKWTERNISQFFHDQSQVMEAAMAQAQRFTSPRPN